MGTYTTELKSGTITYIASEPSRRLSLDSSDKFVLTESGISTHPAIKMTAFSVDIGCTTVTRAVIEALAKHFNERFPVRDHCVKIQ